MRRKDRQSKIADTVRKRGKISSLDLAAELNVSVETVRRDLVDLAERGLVQKVHGGAKRPRLFEESSFSERLAIHESGKRQIARKLLSVIEPGDTLFLDTGSTTLMCAETLVELQKLTIITNSVAIAQVFAQSPGTADVYLLGGAFRADNRQTVGPLAIDQVGEFRADHAVLAVAAIDAQGGAMDAAFDEARVARAMIDNAGSVVVLADASKIGRKAAFHVCDLREIDVFVSDREPTPELALALNHAGVVCP
ncbi:MAG: DeoR/GlpR family DNA-binding transcription regulator [Geminicoccaceae bacterium]